jgi:hypothetical protein
MDVLGPADGGTGVPGIRPCLQVVRYERRSGWT